MVKISLRAARTHAGLSQKDAADRLGVTPKTLGNWEKGRTFPPVDKVLAICELYGVPYDQLNFLPTDSLKAKE